MTDPRHPIRFRLVLALALLLGAALTGCERGGPGAETSPGAALTAEELQARAEELAHEMLLVDTHVDVPYRLAEKMEDISEATEGGDFDYPRARVGGLDAAFMSIYVPARFQETGGARDYADELIDMVEEFETKWPEKFAVVRSPEELRRTVAAGKIALPLGMENGAAIEDDVANLSHFHARGIRYITLTHSENNQICDSSYAQEKTWKGLSPFGRQVVEEMNRLGIMIDVSHISDDTFWQIMEITKAPVIASHSSVRTFTPGWERNMDDDMIVRLAEGGGVIQINFGSAFLTEAANKQSYEMFGEARRFMEEHALERGDPQVEAHMEEWRRDHPTVYAGLEDVVAHIDHVVKLVGVDHVGFGSDFDGVGDSLPEGLKSVADYPNLVRALLEKGYSEADVAKIAGANLVRVWEEVERVARELQRQEG